MGLFFRRKMVWWPTSSGWGVLLLPPLITALLWVMFGESFLSLTRRVPARVLVVEGWIGRESLTFAEKEFGDRGYTTMIIAGGLTGHSWSENRESVTDYMKRELLKHGFPEEKLLLAPCRDVATQRTFESATTVRSVMSSAGFPAANITVISRGVHARRTYLVYRKAFEADVKIGILSWNPYASDREPWWKSSTRAKEMMEETVGYLFEVLLDSGRTGMRIVVVPLVTMSVLVVGVYRRSRSRVPETSVTPISVA